MTCKSKPNGSGQGGLAGRATTGCESAPAALMLKRTAEDKCSRAGKMNGAITPTVQGTPAKRRCAGGGRAQDHRQREHAEREGARPSREKTTASHA